MNARRFLEIVTSATFIALVNERINPYLALPENERAAKFDELVNEVGSKFDIRIKNAPAKEGSGKRGKKELVIPIPNDKFTVNQLALENEISLATAVARMKSWISTGQIEKAQGMRSSKHGGKPSQLWQRATVSAENVAQETTEVVSNPEPVQAVAPVAVENNSSEENKSKSKKNKKQAQTV